MSKNKKEKSLIEQLDAADSEAPKEPNIQNTSGSQDLEGGQLIEKAIDSSQIHTGKVLKGTVTRIGKDFVVVDIGYKSDGLIPVSEFHAGPDGMKVEIGDEVEVYVEQTENNEGTVVLSKSKADIIRVWNDISRIASSGEIIEGTVVSKVKGGLSVNIGVVAFLPGSQVDIRPIKNLGQFLGKTLKFKVIKFNKRRGNIVLSRRAVLEEERKDMGVNTVDTLQEGAVVKGFVKNVTDYGAFIDLGGVDGLLHVTDISWLRIKHPSEKLTEGDEVSVKILKYDTESGRVNLGMKQLEENPWDKAFDKFHEGSVHKGRVVSLTKYGAFVELEEGVEGLIHTSEVSWKKRIKHVSEVLKEDQEIEVMVVKVDRGARRISLSYKQMQDNPWGEIEKKYPPGTIVESKVKSVTDFGVFISLDDDVDGLIHVSDFSWNRRISHPSDFYKPDQTVQAVVLGVDVKNQRISLGVKQLTPDPWGEIEKKYPIGSKHKVRVIRLADFGAFVELEPEVEGLIHVSELAVERVEKPSDVVKEGETLQAEVVSMDRELGKIGLSVKTIILEASGGVASRKDIEKHSNVDISSSHMGEAMNKVLSSDATKPKAAPVDGVASKPEEKA